jgi:hypothetical protein
VDSDEAQAHLLQLQTANFQLSQHLQQIGRTSQCDKAALGNLQERYTQLASALSESEARRTWFEKEYQAVKQTLMSERKCHAETKSHVQYIWTATKRILDLYNGGGDADGRVANPMVENEAKGKGKGGGDEEVRPMVEALARKDGQILVKGLLENTTAGRGRQGLKQEKMEEN